MIPTSSVNEWMNEWMNEWIYLFINESMYEWMNEFMCEATCRESAYIPFQDTKFLVLCMRSTGKVVTQKQEHCLNNWRSERHDPVL
jgi:hypothetical protein